jgi:hypothetical protein
MGCNGRNESLSQPAQAVAIQVLIEPADLMTSVRGSPIHANVGRGGPRVPEAVLESLKGAFSLWEVGGQKVPISINLESNEGVPRIVGRQFTILPQLELKAAWYEIHVDLTLSTEVAAHPSLIQLSEHTFKSRFNPDSAPVLQSIQLCASQDSNGPSLIRVTFSEPVDFVPTNAAVANGSPIDATVDDVACDMAPVVDNESNENFHGVFEFICPERGKELIQLVLERDLIAASGATAMILNNGVRHSRLALPLSESYPTSGNCVAWHLP